MFASIFVLAGLPWLDSSKVRSATFRPIYRKFFWVLVVTVILLGYLGAKPPEGIYLILARVATAYYFIHFLILLPFMIFSLTKSFHSFGVSKSRSCTILLF